MQSNSNLIISKLMYHYDLLYYIGTTKYTSEALCYSTLMLLR